MQASFLVALISLIFLVQGLPVPGGVPPAPGLVVVGLDSLVGIRPVGGIGVSLGGATDLKTGVVAGVKGSNQVTSGYGVAAPVETDYEDNKVTTGARVGGSAAGAIGINSGIKVGAGVGVPAGVGGGGKVTAVAGTGDKVTAGVGINGGVKVGAGIGLTAGLGSSNKVIVGGGKAGGVAVGTKTDKGVTVGAGTKVGVAVDAGAAAKIGAKGSL